MITIDSSFDNTKSSLAMTFCGSQNVHIRIHHRMAINLFVLWLSLSLGFCSAQWYGNYHCVGGRDVMVHLFEWKWNDIAQECSWLAEHDFCGVQVSICFPDLLTTF